MLRPLKYRSWSSTEMIVWWLHRGCPRLGRKELVLNGDSWYTHSAHPYRTPPLFSSSRRFLPPKFDQSLQFYPDIAGSLVDLEIAHPTDFFDPGYRSFYQNDSEGDAGTCNCVAFTLRPRQNGRHFPYDIFKCIFMNTNVWISIKFSPKIFS